MNEPSVVIFSARTIQSHDVHICENCSLVNTKDKGLVLYKLAINTIITLSSLFDMLKYQVVKLKF